jgi:hypothetical protein
VELIPAAARFSVGSAANACPNALRSSVTLGLPQRAAVIAEAAAMQESSLVNLPDGTDDSLGLFQQRPSQGWGTPAQIMQPVYASTRFYEALVSVPGGQSLPLTVAAQAVQGSATPGAYAKWEPLADSLVATFSGNADNCLTDNGASVPQSGITRLPAGFALPSGTPQAVVTAIAYAADQLGKPYVFSGVLAVRSRSIPMFAQLRRLMSVTLAVQRVWCKQLLILSSGVSRRRRSCMRWPSSGSRMCGAGRGRSGTTARG